MRVVCRIRLAALYSAQLRHPEAQAVLEDARTIATTSLGVYRKATSHDDSVVVAEEATPDVPFEAWVAQQLRLGLVAIQYRVGMLRDARQEFESATVAYVACAVQCSAAMYFT